MPDHVEVVRPPTLPPVEDLLDRRERRSDLTAFARFIAGKRVLVTGAGGSIGSQICRTLLEFAPASVVMLDRDESALEAVLLPLSPRDAGFPVEMVLADIRDAARIGRVVRDSRPDVIFHAAALKHVPLLERHVGEAFRTNVLGTLNVLTSAAANGVGTVVNLSTDKAAAPTSVLGRTKHIAERITTWYAERVSTTCYVNVRLGNVLGSRGSVLDVFRAKLAAGAPLPVTDTRATRYFMTTDEAVALLCNACVIGAGGDTLVPLLDRPVGMGEFVDRIRARVGTPVEVVQTGLRPGEKLHEVLVAPHERAEPHPEDPAVLRVRVEALNPGGLSELLVVDGSAERLADPAAVVEAGSAR